MNRYLIGIVATVLIAGCSSSPSYTGSGAPSGSPISISGETNVGVVSDEGGTRPYTGTDVTVNLGF
ncbi:MAG: hypothetical protein ACSHXD_09185 [Marinosulfonomonas sp.]